MGFFTGRDDLVQELLQHVDAGKSFSQIARIMGAPSRNVVLCKFNRLRRRDPNLKYHNTRDDSRREPTTAKPKKPRVVAPLPPAEALPAKLGTDGSLVTYLTVVRNMCRFPIGDPLDPQFHVCGNDVKQGSPYCAHHHAMCYVPIIRKYKDHKGKKRA